MEVLQAEGAVRRLLLTSGRELVVVTENMVIGQFRVEPDGTVSETSRVKLSTRTKENHMAWVDDTHLAVSSGDLTVRGTEFCTERSRRPFRPCFRSVSGT